MPSTRRLRRCVPTPTACRDRCRVSARPSRIDCATLVPRRSTRGDPWRYAPNRRPEESPIHFQRSGRVAAHDTADAQVRECRSNRPRVTGAVVDDDDVTHSDPFVERTSEPSRVRAWASARPTALNAASATWWSFSPVAVTWSVIRAFGRATERRGSPCPIGGDRDVGCGPTGEVDHGVSQRLVHRHASLAVTSEPRRSPSASSSASPKVIIMSSTMWCSPVSRSPHPRGAGPYRRGTPLLEHVVVETEARVHVDAPWRERVTGCSRASRPWHDAANRGARHRLAVEDRAQSVEQDVVVELVLHTYSQSPS